MPNLTHLPADAPIDEIMAVLDRDGALILDDVLSIGEADAFREELRPYVEATQPGRDTFTGRHTTSQSTLYLLPADAGGGWIVDSPGLKVFGLAHVAPDTIPDAFVEIRPLLGHCRFRDCRHDREPGCAVQEAVDRGEVAPFRVALMHRLLRESVAIRAPGR